jgi:acyl-CoA synthetase (AMP-forming)/AMP-acid ligase II
MSALSQAPGAAGTGPVPGQVFRSELNPVDFLYRAAYIHPDKTAVVDGERRYSYRQLAERSWRLANALRSAGLAKGDRVATLLFNSLNALNEVIVVGLSADSAYLWTLPMFHCNGWCFPWAVTAATARHVTIRAVDPQRVWELIDAEGVTHYNGAPTVQLMILNHPRAHRLDRPVTAMVAAAPPSPTLFARMSELNFRVVHVYGLTETCGPITVCPEQEAWRQLPLAQRARYLARQGQAYLSSDLVRVVDDQMNDIPQDGQIMGEVVMRGNIVISGYLDDPAATSKAFHGGWFHSGDLAVWHPDGNIELRDRGKDIIISGGENISSIEVEQAIAAHPAVLECAVIGIPDPHGASGPRPTSLSTTAPRRPLKRSSRSAASAWPTTSARTRSSSGRCRRPPPARCRSSCCANANGQARINGSAVHSTRNHSRHRCPPHPILILDAACTLRPRAIRFELSRRKRHRAVIRANRRWS